MVTTNITLCGLPLDNPVIPASGTFGYGYEFAELYDINCLGTFSFKGTTREPRLGNSQPRIAEMQSGVLNAVGLQNPGVDAVIAEELPKLARVFRKPVMANVSGFSLDEYVEVCQKLDACPQVGWLEVNISCPNVHGGGKIGVMVRAESPAGAIPEILAAAKDCALQVAAMNPPYLKREDVPAAVLDEEKKIILAQMAEDPKMANKPEQVKEKIAAGKVGKYYGENCLLEQAFVKENKETVQSYVDGVAKAAGTTIAITDFVRFERGEGIEKKADNFAEEIASMIK